ncbi:NUDIX domain-containing protein [Streptomyces scopuliridis]|uniref:NUDIX domain-containing protein n=1 Tax=Streptomyces scopuliridis TaxID=452529 RepID=UPI003CC808A2
MNPTYKPGWDPPGGMAEPSEPLERAVRRELREKLGRGIDKNRSHRRPGVA